LNSTFPLKREGATHSQHLVFKEMQLLKQSTDRVGHMMCSVSLQRTDLQLYKH